MSIITLQSPSSLYLEQIDTKIYIKSPIATDKHHKGIIGVQLQGLHIPDAKMIIRFHPAPEVIVQKLEKDYKGSALYIKIPKGNTLKISQPLGFLTAEPLTQFADYEENKPATFFRISIYANSGLRRVILMQTVRDKKNIFW